MQKKLSQKLIITTNAISFAGAAIFGGMGVFAAIASFTKGDWTVYGAGFEGLLGSVSTSFFLAVLALLLGLLAKYTIKKMKDAALLKKAYGILAFGVGCMSAVFVAIATSIALYALIGLGSKSIDQPDLWLNGFLPATLAAIVTAITAKVAKKVAMGKVVILPLATDIVLGVSALSLLLMIISTVLSVYGDKKPASTGSKYIDDLYNYFY